MKLSLKSLGELASSSNNKLSTKSPDGIAEGLTSSGFPLK